MYASTTILNSFIALQPGRNSMGYLKLVYIAQGWSTAFGRPVVADLPSLLESGPAHLAAYDAMHLFGPAPIGGPVCARGFTTPMAVPTSDTATIDLLKEVVAKYGHLTDIQLSNHCHREGTPWRNIRNSRAWKARAGGLIHEIEIRDHFSGLLAEHETTRLAEERSVGRLVAAASTVCTQTV